MPGTQTFDTHLSAFGPGGWKVRVNTMWFGSLVMSLIAAGFSIHCKQWLDGYGVRLHTCYRLVFIFIFALG